MAGAGVWWWREGVSGVTRQRWWSGVRQHRRPRPGVGRRRRVRGGRDRATCPAGSASSAGRPGPV